MVIILIYVLLRIQFFTYLPIFDATAYYSGCLQDQLLRKFDLYNFNCNGHPSWGFMLPFVFLHSLDFGNLTLMHLLLTVMGIIGITAFHGILCTVFDRGKYRHEISLMALISAVYPVTFVASVNFTPDFGVYVYFLVFLYFLMKKAPVPAAISAVLLIFSKETGLLLYGTSVFLYLTIAYLVRRKDHEAYIRQLVLLIPGLVFTVFILVSLGLGKLIIFPVKPEDRIGFLSPDVFDRITFAYFAKLFILNFNWIVSVFILIMFVRFSATIFRQKKIIISSPDREAYKNIFLLAAILSFSFFVLTRFKTYTNVRYFLPFYPVLLIIGFFAITAVLKKKVHRIVVLISIVMLFFSGNFHSVDPVSRWLFGTFAFGKHTLYSMTTLSRENDAGHGWEQLFYNTQITNLSFLYDRIYATLPYGANIFDPHYRYAWHIHSFDAARKGIFFNHLVSTDFPSGNAIPKNIYYVDYPFFFKKFRYADILTAYRPVETTVFDYHGYVINVEKMERR